MRYKLYSNQGLKIINMFANLNEPLHYLKKQHLFTIFNEYLSESIKLKNNVYMICDKDVKALTIINRNNKKCYIYVKDLFEFDINNYLELVLDQNSDFTWIITDESIYRRLTTIVDTNDILVTDKFNYIDTSVDNLVNKATKFGNESLEYTSSLSEEDVDNILNGQFYKIIDNNHIYIFNRSKVTFLHVADAKDFLNRYFISKPMDIDSDSLASNDYGEFSFEGYKATFKGNIILSDMKRDINGLVSIDYLTDYYKINNIYLRNLNNVLLNKMIIVLFETVSISKEELVYVEQTQDTNLYKYLGFNASLELTTTYLYNGDIDELYKYPEIENNLKKEFNIKAFVIQNVIMLAMILVASYTFISYMNRHNIVFGSLITTYILFMTLYISVYFRPRQFIYKDKIIKKYYFIRTNPRLNILILVLNILAVIILLLLKS